MSEKSLFEETSESKGLEEKILNDLGSLCYQFKGLEIEIDKLERELKEKKRELENVSRNLIPSIFNSIGLSEIKLSSGEKVSVEDKIKASIVHKNYLLAYKNMIKEEGGDENAKQIIDTLFKSETILEDISDETLDFLIENNIPYNSKKNIHYQTLSKYCREKLGLGKEIPEGISVFQYQETKIK